MELVIIGLMIGPGSFIGSMAVSQEQKERTVGALLTWALLISGFIFGSMSIGAHAHNTTAELLYCVGSVYTLIQWLIALSV